MLAGEKPPVEPVAALAHTQDGAVAFAQFWIQTLDWGYATTSTVYARHYIDPICTTCTQFLAQIDAEAAANHRYIGDRMTVTSATIKANGLQQNGSDYYIVVLVDITGAELVDSNYKFVAGDKPYTNRPFSVLPKWTSGGWRVVSYGSA